MDPHTEHDKLFSETGLRLGKILWHLLRAAREVNRLMFKTEPAKHGLGVTMHLTEFGEEVKDEIHWWIYKEETDVEELSKRVNQTLLSAQALKAQSKHLEPSQVKTYTELVTLLARFMESHKKEIDNLYDFVLWLHSKDPLAPSMLFSYRVWGSTRRSQRWLELTSTEISVEPKEVIEHLTEIVCGLVRDHLYRYSSIRAELLYEQYESDPENYYPSDVPESLIVSRAAHEIVDDFAEFFEQFRDSLRNIGLDIEKYLAEKNLLKSETFWAKFILKSKVLGRVESPLWDFKETLPMWHSKGDKQQQQIEFCKLVAAFANNEGGAIIIDVTDKSRDIVSVPNLEHRIKSASEAIQKCIDYPRKDTIIHFQPVLFERDDKNLTCLVVVVAQAADVVRVEGLPGEGYHYPDRDEAGLTYPKPTELESRKAHLKAGDNFGFIKQLEAFLYDK